MKPPYDLYTRVSTSEKWWLLISNNVTSIRTINHNKRRHLLVVYLSKSYYSTIMLACAYCETVQRSHLWHGSDVYHLCRISLNTSYNDCLTIYQGDYDLFSIIVANGKTVKIKTNALTSFFKHLWKKTIVWRLLHSKVCCIYIFVWISFIINELRNDQSSSFEPFAISCYFCSALLLLNVLRNKTSTIMKKKILPTRCPWEIPSENTKNLL